jgi:hypothetical protein
MSPVYQYLGKAFFTDNNSINNNSITMTASSSSSSSEYLENPAVAPAHRQFLPYEDMSEYTNLKGIPHNSTTSTSAADDDVDESLDYIMDVNIPLWAISPEKTSLSAAKKRGGGSWLLGSMGFAKIQSGGSSSSNNSCSRDDDENDDDIGNSENVPGLTRSNSSSSLSSSSDSSTSTSSGSSSSTKSKGVSFNESVHVLPIPHASTYSPSQRRKMYTTTTEVRSNKIRNKKEYRYDGCDWRNVTEEWEMSVCMVTGELVHPVHTI